MAQWQLASQRKRPHSFTFHLTAAGVPMGLEQPLRQMVAPVAGARPPAAAFPGCAFFQSDVLLRALKVWSYAVRQGTCDAYC